MIEGFPPEGRSKPSGIVEILVSALWGPPYGADRALLSYAVQRVDLVAY